MNWTLIQNSLFVAGATTVVALLIGCCAALFALTSDSAKRFLIPASIVTFALPPFLVTNTWMHYFGLAGIWRQFLDWNVYSFSGAILLLSLSLWPVAFLMLYFRLRALPRDLIEAAPRLTRFKLLHFLVFPFSKSVAQQAAVIIFTLALNNFAIPTLLQIKVFPEELWLKFNTTFSYSQALAVSWPLIVAPVILLLFLRTKTILFWEGQASPMELMRQRIGQPLRFFSGAITALIILFSLLLPIFQLLSSSRSYSEFLPALKAGKSAIYNSFTVALFSAVLITIIGLISRRSRAPVFSWFFYLAPGVFVGMSLIFLFNKPSFNFFYQSIWIVLLAYLIRYLAPVWSAIRYRFGALPQPFLDFARITPSTSLRRFRYLDWPWIKTILPSLFYLTFLLCLWDVETLIFIVPAGGETLSLRIFNMLHYGHAGQVDALCIILLVVAIVPLLLWQFWQKMKPCIAALGLIPAVFMTGCDSHASKAQFHSDFFSAVQVVGSRGSGASQFNKPRSVIVDKKGSIFAVDMTGRVQKFSPKGNYLLSWQMPQTDKGKPKGMTLDQNGNVVLVEPHYSRVNHFDEFGKLLAQWGEVGTNVGKLIFPRSVGVNSRGEVYLSEYGLAERVQRFSPFGKSWINSFGEPGTAPGQFNRVEGMGIDRQDRVYVADSCNNRIEVFTPEGKLITTFGRAGTGLGEMSYPYDIRIDRWGYRFVCEFGNSRIQIFDPNNQPVEILGKPGFEPGEFNNPWSIALDESGNLYVADSGNHRVQVFTRKNPADTPKSKALAMF